MAEGNGADLELEEQLKTASELEAQLAEEKKKGDEYLDNWRRTAAEFQNYKRRMDKDKADYAQYANERLLKRLLDVLDSFDFGFKAMPDDVKNAPWGEGMRAVQRQIEKILESEGVTPIETQGQAFDPKVHEAMFYEPAPGANEGQILDELQRGYRLNDRVLRPSRVKVAKGE